MQEENDKKDQFVVDSHNIDIDKKKVMTLVRQDELCTHCQQNFLGLVNMHYGLNQQIYITAKKCAKGKTIYIQHNTGKNHLKALEPTEKCKLIQPNEKQ